MESIDRLREYVESAPRVSIGLMARATMLGMVRAIESEVNANRVDAYTKGYDEGFASADDWVRKEEGKTISTCYVYGLSQLEERIDALERRIEAMERKLNHKGGDE